MSNIRVRIAPSPTGYLHIGTARTALFNWLFAKHHKGQLVLRIEDTDIERSDKKFEEDILDGLKWLGLNWDEFCRQSDRTEIYAKYIKQLLDNGKAFWCYHTKEELETEQKKQQENKEAPRHVCSYKHENPKSEIAYSAEATSATKAGLNPKQGIIRLAVDENSDRKIKFKDIIRGDIEFDEKNIGDLSIAKAERAPLYNFAVVVDDYENSISHVIRGEDHIANTPKQILIQEALGFDLPEYAHMPLILGPDRSKLSKRHGATALMDYRSTGYIPEALVNYLALLGWTPKDGREILSVEELTQLFELNEVHKSGAVFDVKKLDWVNSEYIKKMPENIFETELFRYIKHGYKIDTLNDKQKFFKMAKERINKFADINEFSFLFTEPEYDKELLRWKDKTDSESLNSLSEVKKIIENIGIEDGERLRNELDELGKKFGDRGLAYWPFRVALSGLKKSPDPVEIAQVLGKDKTLQHLEGAIGKLK